MIYTFNALRPSSIRRRPLVCHSSPKADRIVNELRSKAAAQERERIGGKKQIERRRAAAERFVVGSPITLIGGVRGVVLGVDVMTGSLWVCVGHIRQTYNPIPLLELN